MSGGVGGGGGGAGTGDGRAGAGGETRALIAYESFDAGDVALFLPRGTCIGSAGQRGPAYRAFSVGTSANVYLDPDISSHTGISELHESASEPEAVLGRIVMVTRHITNPSYNPFGLEAGVPFSTVMVTRAVDSP